MADIPKDAEDKINQLQLLEQSLQSFSSQKQQFQSQVLEIDSALEELKKSEESYKVVGSLMVKTDKDTLQKDLEQKKEMLDVRLKALDKQESQMKEKATKLQEEVMSQIKKDE